MSAGRIPKALADLGIDVVRWLTAVDRTAAAQGDSTAATVAELKADLNALLAKLRAAKMMAE